MLEKRSCRVDAEKCVGCRICEKNCPIGAVAVEKGRDGQGNGDRRARAAIDAGRCVGCGVCLKLCPKGAVALAEARPDAVMCLTCPVHCCVAPGEVGACRRFENRDGVLERTEPYLIVDPEENRLDPLSGLPVFPLMLGLGVGSNLYSTDVPAKVVAAGEVEGVEVVSCVTETVLSFNGARVKVDTDEFLGDNGTPVKRGSAVVGFINTAEYGSQMIHVGGSHLNTGPDGHMVLRTTCDLLNKKPVVLKTSSVGELVLQHGRPPIVDGKRAERMRIGCGTIVATTFTLERWGGKVVDEVITVDYDITSKMSAHTTAGVRYGYPDSGVTPVGTYSSQGRYFGVPGNGWGGSNVMNGRDAIKAIDKSLAWPGLRLLVTEPTAERAVYFELDGDLEPVEKPIPPKVMEVLEFIRDNCEPCGCFVSVVAGFGGGVRDVISRERSLNVNEALRAGKINYTICGRPTNIYPGGGITAESCVDLMPEGAFTWVPTPAMVCPMEATMTKKTYEAIGGYLEAAEPVDKLAARHRHRLVSLRPPGTRR